MMVGLLGMLSLAGTALAQQDQDNEPTAALNFLVVKDDNGKAIRSAAVILHPVNKGGNQVDLFYIGPDGALWDQWGFAY